MNYKNHKMLALEEFKDKIDSKVQQKTSLLDAGCGDDTFLRDEITKLGWSWVGIDVIKTSFSLVGKMEKLPLPDSHFQVIFLSHSFEHCENPIKALREFHRVLKGGGALFMVTPYPCKRQISWMDKTHWFVLNEMQLENLLLKTGFQIVSIKINKNESEDESQWHIVTVANVI